MDNTNKVFAYIAERNPEVARKILGQFGYITSSDNMADALQQLVNKEGEPAFRVIMAYHPDKEVLFELFGKEDTPCTECSERAIYEKWSNINGGTNQNQSLAKTVESNFSVLFLAGVVILAVAIIKK